MSRCTEAITLILTKSFYVVNGLYSEESGTQQKYHQALVIRAPTQYILELSNEILQELKPKLAQES